MNKIDYPVRMCKKWRRWSDEPCPCSSCLNNNDNLNGFNSGFIIINGLKIYIDLCDKHLKKLKSKYDN